jgi:putative membrane protein
MNSQLNRFISRWLVCGLGLWIATGFLSNDITYQNRLVDTIIAGLFLAILNILLKPVLIVLSLPAIVFSLGLFMIIINGFIVYLVSKLYEPLHITNFWAAVFAGMVIGLVNYLVTTILESRNS